MKDLQAGVDSGRVAGSPHLRHRKLHSWILNHLTELVSVDGAWLDIGAGHGAFVSVPLRHEMPTVATEMSQHALRSLRAGFSGYPLDVREASDTDAGLRRGEQFTVVSMVSVIHHIPNYLEFIEVLVRDHIARGGVFICFQDPLYYPRIGATHLLHRAMYYPWRATQGDLIGGMRRILQRRHGIFESTQADTIEYHVVRNGVDEEAVIDLLGRYFESVELKRYWSSQDPISHWIGDSLGMKNTFGVIARSRT